MCFVCLYASYLITCQEDILPGAWAWEAGEEILAACFQVRFRQTGLVLCCAGGDPEWWIVCAWTWFAWEEEEEEGTEQTMPCLLPCLPRWILLGSVSQVYAVLYLPHAQAFLVNLLGWTLATQAAVGRQAGDYCPTAIAHLDSQLHYFTFIGCLCLLPEPCPPPMLLVPFPAVTSPNVVVRHPSTPAAV